MARREKRGGDSKKEPTATGERGKISERANRRENATVKMRQSVVVANFSYKKRTDSEKVAIVLVRKLAGSQVCRQ